MSVQEQSQPRLRQHRHVIGKKTPGNPHHDVLLFDRLEEIASNFEPSAKASKKLPAQNYLHTKVAYKETGS